MLIRHAQASFFADEYDRLSEHGERQAIELGRYFAGKGVAFSEVHVGPRRRQQQTAELVGSEFRRARVCWPEPVIQDDLDEYDLTGLLNRLAPHLATNDRAFEQLALAYARSTSEPERLRSFQRMFEAILAHWQRAPADSAAMTIEPWEEFRDRVGRALDRITAGAGTGRRVAAFTSGGFIGTAVARALSAPDATALELSWRLRNASLTTLVFSPGRLTLDDFNTIAHFTDETLWTYR